MSGLKLQKLNSLRMAWPTDWAVLFSADRPLIMEIGFGFGQFLLHLGRQNPGANVIGLEIAGQCLRSVEGAVERNGLENVRIIQSTAETALHHLFAPESLSQIHINFPDPWFKKRHHRRRLMQRDTLDTMVNRLKVGGKLFLATDILEYAEMSAELLAETPGLDNQLDSAWADALPGRAVTKYEGRAIDEGRPRYYFAYQRNALPAPDVLVIKDIEMTHLVFKSPLTLDDMLAKFEMHEHSLGDTHITMLQGYRGRSTVMFEVYVREPTIDQHIGLILAGRTQKDEFVLKMGTLGYPRVTPGLHRAIRLLGDWLVSLHPAAALVSNTVKEED